MARILAVDDDAAFRESLVETLQGLGHEVHEAASGDEALRQAGRHRYAAIFLDHRMPGMDGLETLAALAARVPELPPVVVLTAYASGSGTIEAMRLGAFDHLTKPVGRAAVIEVLERALRSRAEADAAPPAPAARAGADEADGELIGVSEAMREVHKRIGLAAASEAPVLVQGETGTGKELVARALHRHSARSAGPFVALNCAAIPKELLESELFGHVKGAFTGAATDRPGCFRAADGGVLLLDEIGDMAPDVQAKLLRALQEGEVTPLGSHRPVKVDVRVVAATHRDLTAAVREGRFREDLRYRLDVLQIALPPLRERLADIVPLAEHFLRRAAAPQPAKRLAPDAARALLAHGWPGNVRELRNAMERVQALQRGPVVGAADLDLGPPPASAAASGTDDGALPQDWLDVPLPEAVERLERQLIAHALEQARGNRSLAARRLGIHRQLLYSKLAQYGME
ncbi:sigma-54 dependent transcriptional regulator [Paracidovorax citrulli]|uniref:Sigma54 specific transcriptional regulator, Fis family n=2 Tax=Paracidovorax citrulli TaxID=80869 RepID=A1TIJ6_PARC0|nr:sigma-54 dependent transcriptional regulator [Paracidovorax citrulli]ABM30784.1 sigma54 specific transcriptional regulator, Fis family [Paracidovorax citrulli AAC00-1]ATG96030.1 sigma-54-dependent Fis family transcriptional regulator [Paracidovorax citrulli]PVY64956.1 Fis family sigma54 specific transcriptional regulator [Paracidovorax citrulli]QCX10858.1 Transcriptional regulatory protein ZraR [Paracidovorax citrulli]REG70851.1 Fis family sigma54 specific transcriptional regulator [Paracid